MAQIRVEAPPLEAKMMISPEYLEGLSKYSWYTADPQTPYMVKANVTAEKGYQLLITDLKRTFYCAGDPETLKNEKKVSQLLSAIVSIAIQPNDKDRRV